MSSFTDQTLKCSDCGKDFIWTASEQEFYQTKGFTNSPRRCPDCRKIKKQQFNSTRQMYDVTCGKCGKPTKVPFKPRGDRPVYCNDCFRQMKQV